jgi:hypothetical protein
MKDAKGRVSAFVFSANGEGLAERSALKSEHTHPKTLDKCNLLGYNMCVTDQVTLRTKGVMSYE